MDELKTKGWLFHGTCGTTNKDIISWWESRRRHFNLFVGLTGFVSWMLVLVARGASLKPGEDFAEPLGMIFGPIAYTILATFLHVRLDP